jgi:hypothetical protein
MHFKSLRKNLRILKFSFLYLLGAFVVLITYPEPDL